MLTNRRTVLGAFACLLVPAGATLPSTVQPEDVEKCETCGLPSESFAIVYDHNRENEGAPYKKLCNECHNAHYEAKLDATFCGRCGIAKRIYDEQNPHAWWTMSVDSRCQDCDEKDYAEWWATLSCNDCGSKEVKRAHGPIAWCSECIARKGTSAVRKDSYAQVVLAKSSRSVFTPQYVE